MKMPKLRPGLITDSWALKLTAIGLAILLWAALRSEDTTRFTMRDVPVDLRLTDAGWVSDGDVDPATVSVEFIGPVRELIRLAFAEATLVVPVEDVEDSMELYRPRAEWLEYEGRFDNLRVDEIRPAVLRMSFQPIEERMVPVAVRLESALKSSTRLTGPPVVEPASVLIHGPRRAVQAVDSMIASVADVEAALRSGAVRLPVDTAGTGVSVSPREVVVRISAEPDSVALPAADGAALH